MTAEYAERRKQGNRPTVAAFAVAAGIIFAAIVASAVLTLAADRIGSVLHVTGP